MSANTQPNRCSDRKLFGDANAGAMHHGKGLKPPINLAQLEEQASARFKNDLIGDGLLSKTEFAEADLPCNRLAWMAW